MNVSTNQAAFVVKTSEGYLCPSDGGDVGWTDDWTMAGHFFDQAEANDTAQISLGYEAGSYEIIPVVIVAGKLHRQ